MTRRNFGEQASNKYAMSGQISAVGLSPLATGERVAVHVGRIMLLGYRQIQAY